jgi:hypothetical protein
MNGVITEPSNRHEKEDIGNARSERRDIEAGGRRGDQPHGSREKREDCRDDQDGSSANVISHR